MCITVLLRDTGMTTGDPIMAHCRFTSTLRPGLFSPMAEPADVRGTDVHSVLKRLRPIRMTLYQLTGC